jgi:hypothetical protein
LPLPMIRSDSKSPNLFRLATILGRLSIGTLLGMSPEESL